MLLASGLSYTEGSKVPKSIHGKPVDEKKWNRAVKEAEKSYNKEENPGKFYAVVMEIYNNLVK